MTFFTEPCKKQKNNKVIESRMRDNGSRRRMGSEKERRKMGLRMRTPGLSTLSGRVYLFERRSEAIHGIISRLKKRIFVILLHNIGFFFLSQKMFRENPKPC